MPSSCSFAPLLSRWSSLLLPRPDPRKFMTTDQTRTNTPLRTPSFRYHILISAGAGVVNEQNLCRFVSPISASTTLCTPGRASLESYVPISDMPPRLKPLIFNDGPLVDFSQPAYKGHTSR
ncbi:hypothetical protein HYPSUDRAFT_33743 [Hypholoma sublateritium FD-334 SS-4]|uniref:Uncharacterized protein n=1 Tax=Hypholoma sublateritium (strain FD-334 SS-4) TaxID=945553 RepID=A0A0D2LKS0_HYPSF|nr:hypothetical protein HYPSUDRAFT_33743 [Hypholoma sublateritium FD-334 SS-4]